MQMMNRFEAKTTYSERDLTAKATTDSFEEIYTNHDLSTSSNFDDPSSGYSFNYPLRWLEDTSMNKRIAIRRLDVTPSSHTFSLTLMLDGLSTSYVPITGRFVVRENDNLHRVLSDMCDIFTYRDEQGKKLSGMEYEYDQSKNKLELSFINYSTSNADLIHFHFDITSTNSNIANTSMLNYKYRGVIEFLKLLNQDFTDQDTINSLTSASTMTPSIKVFDNVWNRDRIYFHASFSTSHRQFIGENGDFYPNLSLLYPAPDNTSTFRVNCSTDTKHFITPLYSKICIQLAFITNYKRSLAM